MYDCPIQVHEGAKAASERGVIHVRAKQLPIKQQGSSQSDG